VACLVTGLVLNKAVSPSKLSRPALLELGGLVILLWIFGAVLLVVAIARFRRAAREDRQEHSRAAAQDAAFEQLRDAGSLVQQLLSGEVPTVERVWDVVLRPDERALLDGRAAYSRFYGSGTPASRAAAKAGKAGKATLAQEVAWALAPRWREQQQARVVVTDQRLLCQVDTHGWLSFEHKAATAIKALPERHGVVLEYPGTSPLCLSGPRAARVIVVVLWALYGADGLREHPALAEVRATVALPPAPITTSTEQTSPVAGGTEAAKTEVTPASSSVTPAEIELVTARSPRAERHRDLLALLAASELVLAQHVAELLQITAKDAIERLEALCKQGAISRLHADPRWLAAYRITPDAAARVDPALPPLRTPELARYRHDAAAGWLWMLARNGRFGPQRAILSRREMQAADATARTAALLNTAGAEFGYRPSQGPQPGVDLVYRDLALVGPSGGWQSVDVMLSPPDAKRLRTMIAQAHRDQTLSQQLFMVNGAPRIRELIEGIAGELGLAERIAFESFDPAVIAGG
jgi:hypothetical protein